MYCKYCGAELHPNAYTCPNCGCRTDNPDCTRPQGKSMLAAGLLAIFLGIFGIHNWYLRRFKPAAVQLCLTLLSGIAIFLCIPFFFMGSASGLTAMMFLIMISPAVCFGVWIWAVVEAIMIFAGKIADGDGNPLV